MPSRYQIFNGEHAGEFGSLLELKPDKITIKLDNGPVVTSPPIVAQYLGSCTERQLKRQLKVKS